MATTTLRAERSESTALRVRRARHLGKHLRGWLVRVDYVACFPGIPVKILRNSVRPESQCGGHAFPGLDRETNRVRHEFSARRDQGSGPAAEEHLL